MERTRGRFLAPPPLTRSAARCELGSVYTELERRPNTRQADCTRESPAGNPWPISEFQTREAVCEACDSLMMEGGLAEDVPNQPNTMDERFRGQEAAAKRDAFLEELAQWVAVGKREDDSSALHLLRGMLRGRRLTRGTRAYWRALKDKEESYWDGTRFTLTSCVCRPTVYCNPEEV